mgnify:CR=1 FL=1
MGIYKENRGIKTLEIFTLLKFIGLFVFGSISVISILYLILNRSRYGILLIPFINAIIIFFVGILFPVGFFLATEIYISDSMSLIFIKTTLALETFSLFLYSLDISILREYGRVPLKSFLIFSLIFSLIMGTLIMPNSVTIITQDKDILFAFDNTITLLLLIHNIFIILYLSYNCIKIRIISEFKRLSNILIILISTLSTSIIVFFHYIILEFLFLREIFMVLFLSVFVIKCWMVLTKPQMYIKLTNKIYFIQIYHKSGVMLYSYEFKNKEEGEDSIVWGNILIGLNHILSEFVKKDDQIDVLKTKNADIVVNYNNEYGFAIILKSLNKKNPYIESCMQQLSLDFGQKYENELEEIKDINKLINVVDFKDTKKLIEKNFEIYL